MYHDIIEKFKKIYSDKTEEKNMEKDKIQALGNFSSLNKLKEKMKLENRIKQDEFKKDLDKQVIEKNKKKQQENEIMKKEEAKMLEKTSN